MDAERVYEQLSAIRTEQARQGVILERHEQRSTQLEERMVPVERHVIMWNGVGKALAVLGTFAGIAGALWKMIG